MHVSVDFQDQTLELLLPDEQVVGAWSAPPGQSRASSAEIIRATLEAPRDFPPLRQCIVPGDRVTIAFDPTINEGGLVLEAMTSILLDSGIEREGLTVLLPSGSDANQVSPLPEGTVVAVHDPLDRSGLAYLAATKAGKRVYLNRHLTDADLVAAGR